MCTYLQGSLGSRYGFQKTGAWLCFLYIKTHFRLENQIYNEPLISEQGTWHPLQHLVGAMASVVTVLKRTTIWKEWL